MKYIRLKYGIFFSEYGGEDWLLNMIKYRQKMDGDILSYTGADIKVDNMVIFCKCQNILL